VDRDGIDVEQSEFYGGAKEPQPPPPQAMQLVNEEEGSEELTRHQPYDPAERVTGRVRTLMIRLVTQDGIVIKRFREVTRVHGADGKVIDPATARLCPVSGLLFSGEGVQCTVCKLIIFPAATLPTILDPEQRVCCRCAKLYGV